MLAIIRSSGMSEHISPCSARLRKPSARRTSGECFIVEMRWEPYPLVAQECALMPGCRSKRAHHWPRRREMNMAVVSMTTCMRVQHYLSPERFTCAHVALSVQDLA